MAQALAPIRRAMEITKKSGLKKCIEFPSHAIGEWD
jgi:hypothetical protein